MTITFGRPMGIFYSYNEIFNRNDLSALHKLVYLYFCRRSNGDGESTPGYEVIARDCSCHRSSVIDAVAQLNRLGLVVKHRRKRSNGSDTSNLYVVFPPDQPFERGKEIIGDSGLAIPKRANETGGGSSRTTPVGSF